MDKTTKFFIRVACGIIILAGITNTAPSVEKFLRCLSNSPSCNNVPFMRWKYNIWYDNNREVEIIELKNI